MPQFFELESMQMLHDGMNGAMARQETISNNMANVNTPGYKRQEVSFKDSLKEAYVQQNDTQFQLHKGHDRHVGDQPSVPVKPTSFEENSTSMRNDKNNVDPDREMAKQAKNSLYYNGLAQFERRLFSDLNSLIGQLQQA